MLSQNNQSSTPPASFTIRDAIELVFRGKWTIILFTFLGFLAAGVLYFITPRIYRSEAKLLIRYVSDSTRIEPSDKDQTSVDLIGTAKASSIRNWRY